MALVADYFRGEVFGRAAEGVGYAAAVGVGLGVSVVATSIAGFTAGFTAGFAGGRGGGGVGGGGVAIAVAWRGGGKLFGESEIDEFEVAVGVEEDIFGFEVAVGYVDVIVEVGEDQGYFGGVELHGGEGEAAGTAEVGEYFPSRGVLELE